MHLTLALTSAHVKFDVWTGPKSKHFDIFTISLICTPQITDLKINVYANEFTPGLWNIDPFRFDSEEFRGWQQTQYEWRMYTSCCLLPIQVLTYWMTRPGNSAHQCLLTKINMTILQLIGNPIFKEQPFECIGNFSNKDVFTRKLISTCL